MGDGDTIGTNGSGERGFGEGTGEQHRGARHHKRKAAPKGAKSTQHRTVARGGHKRKDAPKDVEKDTSNAKENDAKREREQLYRERIALLRPIDDEFMRCLFIDNIALAEAVLRTITGINDLVLERIETQRDVKRLAGSRSVCLDVWGHDTSGTLYDLEVQRGDTPNPRRARYHSAVMDADTLNSSEDFSTLPESYVIFLMEHDPFGSGMGTYWFDRVDRETNRSLGDGTHILYANGAYRGNDALGSLMRDFCETDPAQMENNMLAERASMLKNEPEGVKLVSAFLEDLYEKGREEGREEGRLEGREEGRVEGRLEGREEGRMEGRLEGREEGRVEGREEGRVEGREEGTFTSMRTIMETLGIGAQQAMDALRISEADRARYLSML